MSKEVINIGWRAPSNIALIKYWGKKGHQLPENGSLSITLDQSSTTTFMSFQQKKEAERDIYLKYYFHGDQHFKFEQKIVQLLNYLRAEIPFLTDYELVFRSENNFPHSAGIASSASSMAALALCLVSMEETVAHKKLSKDDFFRRASCIARLGSGSACRSVFGGIVAWGNIASISNSSDDYAIPFSLHEGSRLNRVRDLILIVSSKEKPVSSSAGHNWMKDHPYREGRRVQADRNLNKIIDAIRDDNYRIIAEISENEALSLHALLITASSGGLLLRPNTLHVVEEIKKFRDSTGLDLFFSIDAGPNVHLIYYEDQREAVLQFVKQTLSQYCENGQWIDDKMGNGPKLMTPEIDI